MDWQDDPQDDPGTEPAEGAPAPDPLADLDEEARTAALAYAESLAAERERAARLEEQNKARGASGKWGNATNQFNAIGVLVDDRGNVAPQDPQKVLSWLSTYGIQTQPTGSAGTTAAPEQAPEIPDPAYDAAGFARYVNELADKRASEQLKPLMDRLDSLVNVFGRQMVPDAAARAKPFLESIGQGAVADTPAFRTAFETSLLAFPLEQRNEEMVIRMAAGAALPYALAAGPPEPPGGGGPAAPPSVPPATQAAAAVQRQSLMQLGASRDTGGRPQETRYDPETVRQWEISKAAGIDMTLEEYAAAEDMPQLGHNAYTRLQEERRQKAARR